jgi:hypothetical protein
MGQAIPRQHPAVVPGHYRLVRALLAVAMIAVIGLTTAVVVLATSDNHDTSASSAQPLDAVTQPAPGQRYDGGPEEGGADVAAGQPRLAPEQALREAARALADGRRYDGGPEEGAAVLTRRSAPATFDNSIKQPPGMRYDGGPEEGTADVTASQPRVTREQAFPGLPRGTTGAQTD